jgi:hypothetical protein
MVYGEVDGTLRALEAGKAMGDVEDGLAVRAGKLDLRGVHPLRLRRTPPGLWRISGSGLREGFRWGRRGRGRDRLGHELRGETLRHAALGTDELGHSGAHGEDAATSGAAHLDRRTSRRGGQAAGHRRREHARVSSKASGGWGWGRVPSSLERAGKKPKQHSQCGWVTLVSRH